MDNHKFNSRWLIDTGLFAVFIILFWLDLTGIALHQWLGIALGGLAAYHLLTHWKWVQAVTERFLKHTSLQARLYYVMDAGLAAGFFVILATGLIISTWLSLSLGSYAAWKNLHVVSSIATLLLLVTKIGSHWRWIVQTARRRLVALKDPAPRAQPTLPLQGLAAGRRDFLKLMGIVGAASFLALGSALDGLEPASSNSLDGLESASSTESSASLLTAQQDSLTASSTLTNNSSSNTAACSIRCPRGCSYPGGCHRYSDSNGNGRCDFGECV